MTDSPAGEPTRGQGVPKQEPKRVLERYDPARRQPEASWVPERARWRKLGIAVDKVERILTHATQQRCHHDDLLLVSANPEKQRRRFRKRARDLKRWAKQARPFILDLVGSVDSPYYGDRLLAQQLEAHHDRFLASTPGPPLPSKARHRPGEPWLAKPVVQLAHLLLPAVRDLKRAREIIYKAFALQGHDDVVTASKIDHILRAAGVRIGRRGKQTP